MSTAFETALSGHRGTVRDLVSLVPEGVAPEPDRPDHEKVLCPGGVHRIHPGAEFNGVEWVEARCVECERSSWLKTTPLGKRAAKSQKRDACHRGHLLTAEGSRLPDGRCRACSITNSRKHREKVKAQGPAVAPVTFEEAYTVRDGRLVGLGLEGQRAFEGEVDDVVDGSLIVRVVSDVEGGRRSSWTAVLDLGGVEFDVVPGDRVQGEAHFTRSPIDVSSSFGQLLALEVAESTAVEEASFGEGLTQAFWRNIRREEGRAGCWVWQGTVDRKAGRGRADVHGTRRLAHAHVFHAFHGPLGPARALESDCGNPLCLRPSHQRIVRVPVLRGAAAENADRNHCRKCGGWLTRSKKGRECVPCRRERDRKNTAAYRARNASRGMEATA